MLAENVAQYGRYARLLEGFEFRRDLIFRAVSDVFAFLVLSAGVIRTEI